MPQPVPGKFPRVTATLNGIEVALDLLPTQLTVERVAELIGVDIPRAARRRAQNERPAGRSRFSTESSVSGAAIGRCNDSCNTCCKFSIVSDCRHEAWLLAMQ